MTRTVAHLATCHQISVYPGYPLAQLGIRTVRQIPNVETFDEYDAETKALNKQACDIRNEDPVYPEVGPLLIDDTTVTDAQAFNISSEYWTIITGTEPVADMFADMKERALSSGYADATEVVQEKAEELGW